MIDPKTSSYILNLTRQIVAERGLTTLMVSMRQALELGDHTHYRSLLLTQKKTRFLGIKIG